MNRPSPLSLMTLMLLSLAVGCGSSPNAGCMAPIAIENQNLGDLAPDFTLFPVVEKEPPVVLSQEYAKGPVLVVFWATWCPSCVEEIPILNEWYDKYTPQGLQMIAVNVAEPRDRVRDFQKDNPMKYPVVLDLEGEVANQFGIVGLPVAVLLAKGGKIIYYGFALPENIEELLANQRSLTP